MKTIPYIPEVLLEFLTKRYPLTDYLTVTDPVKLNRLHGRMDVIQFLTSAAERQKAEALKPKS